MEKNRVFTNEELQEMIAIPTDVMLAAVKAGDKEKALERLDFIYDLWCMAFDLRISWDKRLTDHIYENMGGDALYDVWKFRGFTEEQIRPMRIQKSDYDECKSYIEAGDACGVAKWIKRNYFNFRHSHDTRIEWETVLKTYIYNHLGADSLWEVMSLVVHDYYDGFLDLVENNDFDFRVRVKQCIDGLHTHGEPLRIEEDDEKVTVWMTTCGSGTYLLEKGIYEAPQNCAKCKACPNTFSVDNFPAYCTHSPLQEMICTERFGWIHAVNTPWDLVDDPNYQFAKECCHFQLFKDPKYIPDRVYEMLGLERPDVSKINFPGYPGYSKK